MDIGMRLKMVRERYGLSQRELAKKAGVTNSTISLIEQNRVSPSVSSLKKLLEGIPMTLGEFFTFDEPVQALPRYIYRPHQQPDLGQNGLRLLLLGVALPTDKCECCVSCMLPVLIRVPSLFGMMRVKNVVLWCVAPLN